MRGPASSCLEETIASTSSRCAAFSQHRPSRSVRSRVGARPDFSIPKEGIPAPRTKPGGVLGDIRTVATPRLTPEKVFDRLFDGVHDKARRHYAAFYSSALGGIVTEPACMVLAIDDHMVHRGHGVFDTAKIVDGYVYQLDAHLERFMRSAEAAHIALPMRPADLKRVLLDTAAASRKTNGNMKFWLSPGRGGFALSPDECIEPVLYAIVSSEEHQPKIIEGYKCMASALPAKPALLAGLKSTNYLLNALATIEAQQAEADMALFVDEEGYLLEGPNMNCGIVTKDLKLVVPPFERCLAGITVQRLMTLVEENKIDPDEHMITGIERRRIHGDEILTAEEAFLCSSSLGVVGITGWNGATLNLLTGHDGQTGPVVTYLNGLISADTEYRAGSNLHTPIPYGYLSGMREQLM